MGKAQTNPNELVTFFRCGLLFCGANVSLLLTDKLGQGFDFQSVDVDVGVDSWHIRV